MNIKSLTKEIIVNALNKEIKDIICIYLFGSFIKDEYRNDSDIDIAFLSEKKIDNIERWEISNLLSEKLKKNIDLVDMKAVSTVMRAQVVSKGICIYESDRNKKHLFEMYSLSDYARLNEERIKIIERIKKEGLVYA